MWFLFSFDCLSLEVGSTVGPTFTQVSFFVGRHIGPQRGAPNENEFEVNRRTVEILKYFV